MACKDEQDLCYHVWVLRASGAMIEFISKTLCLYYANDTEDFSGQEGVEFGGTVVRV